jgi:cytochrome P450
MTEYAAAQYPGDEYPGDGPAGFDPLVSDTVRDPHQLYRDMRARCPVQHSDRYNGFWAITRYDDVRRVLTESGTFITSVQNIVPKIAFTGRRPPLHLDPPEHTAYRTILNPLMSAARVAAVEPEVREYARRCLRPMLERGHGDFGVEFAGNFPVMAFARFLNVAGDTMARVQAHFLDFNKAIKDDEPDGMRAASLALYDLTRELIADREDKPRDPATDPATALLQARPGGAPLPRELVVGTLRQVLLVGIVAPRFVLGSFAVHLAGDPALAGRLRADPSLIPDAVEELLRLYSPYRGFARTANRDVEVGGCLIRKDEPIAMVFTSANRDEDVFPDPDTFRLGRQADDGRRHIAFGLGPHHCPGANWARMELRVALEELLAATAGFELAGPVEMTRWPEFGPESVPLRLHERERP